MSWDALDNLHPNEAQDPTWGDWAKLPVQTTANIGAGLAGLARGASAAGDNPNAAAFFKGLQSMSRKAGQDIEGSMTETGRHRANLSVTDPEYWDNPFANTMMKVVGATPYVVAGGVPGAIIKEAGMAIAATMAAGGTMAAGDVTEEVQSRIDKASADDLKKQSPLFRSLYEEMGEAGAREAFSNQMLGWKPLIAFALGTATGSVGPAANLVRGIKGVGRPGIGKAAVGGAAGEFVEEGYGGVAAQKAEIEGGAREDYSPGDLASRALTGALVGGVMGGATGIGGGKKSAAAPAVERVEVGHPDAATQAALSVLSESPRPPETSRNRAEDAAEQVLSASSRPPPTAGQQAAGVAGDVLGQSPTPPPTAGQQAAGVAGDVLGQSPVPPQGPPQQGPPSPADMGIAPQAPPPPAAGQGAPPAPPQQTARAPAQPPPLPQQPPPLPQQPPPTGQPQPPPLPPGAMTDGTTGEQIAATQTTAPTPPPPIPTDVSARARTPKTKEPTPLAPDRIRFTPDEIPEGATPEVKEMLTERNSLRAIVNDLGDSLYARLDPATVGKLQDANSIKTITQIRDDMVAQLKLPTTPAAKPAAKAAAAKVEATDVKPPAPAGSKGKKILEDISAKARINKQAQSVDQEQKAVDATKAEATQGKEKVKKPGNRTKAEKDAKVARSTAAEPIVAEHFTTHAQLEIPKTKEERLALATTLQEALDKAAEQGHVLREDIPAHIRRAIKNPGKYPGVTKEERDANRAAYNSSIPQKVSSETDQVMYLREIAGVRDALVRGDNPERVEMFVTEHNAKDLAGMRTRRTQAGYDIQSFRGKSLDVEGGENTLTEQGKVITPDSVGKVVPGKKLTGNEFGAAAADIMSKINKNIPPPPVTETKTDTPPAPKPASRGAQALATAQARAKTQADAAQARADKQAEKKAAILKKPRKPKAEAKPKEDTKTVTPEVTEAKPVHVPIKFTAEEQGNLLIRRIDEKAQALLTREQADLIMAQPVPESMKITEAEQADAAAALAAEEQARAEKAARKATRAANVALVKEGKLPSTSRVPKDIVAEKREAAADALYEAELAARTARAAATPPPIPVKTLSADEKRNLLALALKKPKPLNSMIQADDERMNLVRINPDVEAAKRGDIRLDETWLDDRERHGSDLHYVVNELYEPDSIVYSDKTSEVLRGLRMDHLPKLPHYIQNFARKRLTEILDHVPLHIIETHVNESLNIEEFTKTGKLPAGFYDPNIQRDGSYKPYIAIDIRMLENPAKFSQVVIHEAIHAALFHQLENNAYFRQRITTLMMNFDEMTKNHPNRQQLEYSLTNVHEFVSESMSNRVMQDVMSELSLDAKTAQRIGVKPNKSRTLWDAFVEKVREIVGFKQVPGMHNFLDETMKIVGHELEKQQARAVEHGMYTAYKPPPSAAMARPDRMALYDTASVVARGREFAGDRRINVGGKVRRWGDRLSSLWMLAERAKNFFGPSNPVGRLFNRRAMQEKEKDHILEQYGGARVTEAIARAEREYPAAMAKAKEVIFKASLHDVDVTGRNAHLGTDVLMHHQAKKLLPELQRAWSNPEIDPVRAVVLDAMKFYKDIHNVTARETIRNILAEGNIRDPALAERIFNDGVTDEDRVNFQNSAIVEALDQVAALKQRKGWFVPFRRYGEFISAAEHKLSVPSNATQISDNTLQFTANVTGAGGRAAAGGGDAAARDMVKDYLEQNSHTPQGDMLTPIVIRKVWVDKNDHTKILEKEEVDAVPAYRVSMQNRHVEFHDTEAQALKNSDAMKDAGMLNPRNHHRDQSYSNEREITGAMGQILRSLEKQQRYIDAEPEQKQAMREMFHDLSLGLSSNTSIKNAMKQRRDVSGMSEDLGRITADYARMTANHVAKLRHRPEIDSIFEEMRALTADKSDKDNFRRGEIYQELINRIYGKDSKAVEEQRDGFVSRLLQVSRLSKLAGPSFHVINAHEPWTTSLPFIGGRHGFVQTARALKDTYDLIGARGGAMAGLRDIAKAYRSDTGFTDYVKMFKAEIAGSRTAGPDKIRRMQEMIDYLDARNLYSNSAVFEIGKFANPNANIAGRALDRADLMANQVGQAIEAINRTVTGLTAYNLEFKKNGGNHEAAMHYAYQTAHETMGDYSHWNAAPVFNTQAGRLALQFKKFGHKTYYMLGNMAKESLKGNPEAMKQFAGLMVTHGLVAGVLGLPTEPFKVALMAANVFGATGFTPEDYDAAVRRLAYDLAGQKGGEIISKGLYRGIGIEVSGRLGLDSPLTQGTPRSVKANDLKAWLMDTVAGAAPAYMLDQVAGVQALMKGDVATAITKMSPIRAVSDITKAVVGVSGPKLSATGREQHEALSPAEAAVRLLGFQPARVAESAAGRGDVAREGRKLSTDRTALVSAWVNASGADKVRAQRAVQAWNQGKNAGAQITQRDLEKAADRRETEEETGSYWRGIKLDKRTKDLAKRADRIYDQ